MPPTPPFSYLGMINLSLTACIYCTAPSVLISKQLRTTQSLRNCELRDHDGCNGHVTTTKWPPLSAGKLGIQPSCAILIQTDVWSVRQLPLPPFTASGGWGGGRQHVERQSYRIPILGDLLMFVSGCATFQRKKQEILAFYFFVVKVGLVV